MARAKGDGGLYRRTVLVKDPKTGEVIGERTFWQASEEVRTDDGKRKRITGSSQISPTLAKKNLRDRVRLYTGIEFTGETKPRKKRSTQLTVGQMMDAWIADHESEISDIQAYKYRGHMRNHIVPHIGDIPLADITAVELTNLIKKTLPSKTIIKGGIEVPLLNEPGVMNVRRCLNTSLNWAVEAGLVPRNPLPKKARPKLKRPESTHEVLQTGHKAITMLSRLRAEEHPDYCRFLFQFLGLRQAERMGLTWRNVKDLHGDHPHIVIEKQLARYANGDGWYLKDTVKGGEPRILSLAPIFAKALIELEKRQKAAKRKPDWQSKKEFADMVFLRPNGKLITLQSDTKDWHKIFVQLGWKSEDYWRGHLNRHVTATWLSQLKKPLPREVVQQILGHKSAAMTLYYARMTARAAEEGLTDYGDEMDNRMNRKSPKGKLNEEAIYFDN